MSIVAAVQDLRPTASGDRQSQWLELQLVYGDGQISVFDKPQPSRGFASWTITGEDRNQLGELVGDRYRFELEFYLRDGSNRTLLRKHRFEPTTALARPQSLVCTSYELSDTAFAIATAVPNPFRDQTVITFTLPLPASSVEVFVYDVLGQEVARLLNSTDLDAGYYSLPFDGTGLPAGAYFYQLRYNDVHASGQMILLP
jgi:hypothetical protein